MNTINLGKISVTLKNQCEIFLPYYKPAGVTQVPSKDINAIIIHKLIVDGKQIDPIKLIFSSNEAADRLYLEETENEEEYLKLKMLWFFSGVIIPNINSGLFYQALTGASIYTPEEYNIPYGAGEVILTYSIRLPIYDENYKLIETKETEKTTVKFELNWLGGKS
jgi:hypothetical protein